MTSFAERLGHRAKRTLIQSDNLDAETRTELWNAIVILQEVFRRVGEDTYRTDSCERETLEALWMWEFKKPRDEMRGHPDVWIRVKAHIFEAEWYEALDLIEKLVEYLKRYGTGPTKGLDGALTEAFNNRFERYLVGYRFIGLEITPIDSSAEAGAVSSAHEDAHSVAGARHALERATSLLADREEPDYPNSVKESISAVEAVVKIVTGEGQLGAGLTKLEAAGLTIHPALRSAWGKMYGWTSDAGGIRHAAIEAADVDQAMAK